MCKKEVDRKKKDFFTNFADQCNKIGARRRRNENGECGTINFLLLHNYSYRRWGIERKEMKRAKRKHQGKTHGEVVKFFSLVLLLISDDLRISWIFWKISKNNYLILDSHVSGKILFYLTLQQNLTIKKNWLIGFPKYTSWMT